MKKSDVTRQRILDVSTKLFATQGYSATGFRQIAREAGVSLNTITYHFGSKDALYQESIELVVEEHFGYESLFDREPADGYAAPQDAADALGRVVLSMMRLSLGNERRWQLVFLTRALMDGNPQQIQSILDHIHDAEAGFRKIVDAGTATMTDRDFRFWQRQLRAQIFFFAASNTSIRMEFNQPEYTDSFIAEIATRVAANCALAAGLPLPS